MLAVAMALTACTRMYKCDTGLTSACASYINKDNPRPLSRASEDAVMQCEQQVDTTIRRLARGHIGLVPNISGMFIPPVVPVQVWSDEEARAASEMQIDVQNCMINKGWIICTWGASWVCQRKP